MRRALPIGIVSASLLAIVGVAVWTGGIPKMNESTASFDDQPAAAEGEPAEAGLERATFGSGCFWCTEAVFQELNGIKSVVSGYSGGETDDPTYDEVCSGATGHAEVIQVTYNPKVVTYPELLAVFWKTHDPTTLNRQGNDSGTQYRSVIFHHNDEQRKQAEHYRKKLDDAQAFEDPIVTEIAPFTKFYPAEKYHQNYYRDNPRASYCTYVIGPKLEKFRKAFKDKLNP